MGLPVVRLLADGGDVTVGRRVSSFIYGVMNVTLADGVVGEDQDKTGLEQGYIVRADGATPSGRFDFNFTRHDASMHMGLHTSDMEQGIVAASRRVEGGVFFERDIEAGGFGRWQPGVDFNVGDVVGVVRWGRVIPLPVTGLDVRDGRWVAHVGGQMIHDAEKLRSQNQSIEKTIADERRRLAKEAKESEARQTRRVEAEAEARRAAVAVVDGKAVAAGDAAKVADGKAVAAQSTADGADGKAQKLAEALSGGGATIPTVMADLQRLNKQLQENDEGGAADQGLIPAYIAANTKRWKLQAELDRQQDYVSDLLSWQVRALEESVQWHRSLAPFTFAISHGTEKEVRFIRASVTDQSKPVLGNMTITNTSDWIDARLSIGYDSSAILSDSSFATVETVLKAGESREVGAVGGFTGASTAFCLISVDPQPRRTYAPPTPPIPPK